MYLVRTTYQISALKYLISILYSSSYLILFPYKPLKNCASLWFLLSSPMLMKFGESFQTLIFIGLPPKKGVTAQSQRENFASQFARQLKVPIPRSNDWNDLFWSLAHYVKKGKILIIFDEISWLAKDDPTFLGKLKTVWDTDYKKNNQLTLILMGSVSSWIEKNILTIPRTQIPAKI